MDEKLNQSLLKAVEETFSSMLGVEVDLSAPEERDVQYDTGDYCVIIGYVGEISGAFVQKCSTVAAVGICSKMLGMEIPVESPDIPDAIGEFFNVITGSAKGYYSNTLEKFKISVPTIVQGSDYKLHIKSDNSNKATIIECHFNGEKIVFEIFKK